MNHEQLLELIPQQHPFRFIDTILDLTQTSIVAQLYLSGNEDFFKGHFPNQPIMPGVLLLESMFQTSIPLTYTKGALATPNNIGVVVRVDNVKFKRLIAPKETLTIKVQLLEELPNAWEFSGKIFNQQNELVASATFRTTRTSSSTQGPA